MSDTTANLALPLLLAAQAQKHVTHNEALQRLDILVQAVVEDHSLTLPPADPAEGESHVVAAGAGGAWAGQDGRIAAFLGGAWVFLTPRRGWRVAVAAGDGTGVITFDGTAWQTAADSVMQVARLGVATPADATNRLAVAAPATLLTHAGAGHQLKLNKAAATDTASLLFQTGWSGRAEMGTTGSDEFQIRTSADGSAWVTALRIDGAAGWASGRATLSARLRSAAGGSANALILTTGGAISGTPPAGLRLRFRAAAANTGAATIALDDGAAVECRTVTGVALPAGYIRSDADTEATFDGTYWVLGREIERGSNANGRYTRLADGSQTCTGKNILSAGVTTAYGAVFANSAEQFWTFPATFASSQDVCCAVSVLANGRWGDIRTTSASVAGVRQYAASSLATAIGCDTTATGYWY